MISVIIPSYGIPQFLGKAIRSVLNQTYTDLELIIVDDNNPNTEARSQTEKLVSSFTDNRITYVKHSYNKNGAAARNTAIAIAQGEFISFLDSDDEYLPDRLTKCIEALIGSTDNIAGVYTGCEFRKSNRTYSMYTDVKNGNYLIDTLACRFMFCTGSNIFLKSNIVKEIGGFDESFIRHQDYEFLVRVFEKHSLKAIPEVLVIKNNENFNLPDIGKMEIIKKQYLTKFDYILKTLSPQERNYIYHCNYVALAETCMRKWNFNIAKKYYKAALKFKPLSLQEYKRLILLPFLKYVRK